MRGPSSSGHRALACFFALLAAAAVEAQPRTAVRQSLERMARQAGTPISSSVSPSTGFATFVSVPRAARLSVLLPATASPAERALGFVDSFGSAFGIGERDQLSLRQVTADGLGYERVRFRQTIRGVPVAGGELSVHLRGSDVLAVHAKTISADADFSVTPLLGAEDAAARVRAHLGRVGIPEALLAPAELQIFNRGLLEGRQAPSRLAWFVVADSPGRHEYVWVDAETGQVLLRFDQRPTVRSRQVFLGNNMPGVLGVFARGEGDPVHANAEVNQAYDYLGDAYDYFFDEHGRDSYDGLGATVFAGVNFCAAAPCPWLNAAWLPELQIFGFGVGFTAADDVVAHEWTHAVTGYSANLFFYMQSGALNESYSDIFGEAIDLVNGAGDDTAPKRWLLGEDLAVFGPTRNMMNPPALGDPGKTSDPELVCDDPGLDAGGVHSNSGVPNHAFALMVDGGAYNGTTVAGIGLEKAAKVQYRALTEYLLTASDFLDNYHALRASCQDLIGTDGISVADCAQVDAALEAVEMHFPWPCNAALPTDAPLCPSGGTATSLLFEDFENTASTAWEGAFSGAYHWGTGVGTDNLYGTGFATSGSHSLHGDDVNALGDSVASMTTSLAIPAGARLQFQHSFGFESNGPAFFDGGMLEYSTTGGASWLDAGGLIDRGARYRGTLFGTNPLAGRSAFVGDSHGYATSQLDLGSLAGQSVRFRFRVATDPFAALGSPDRGWFVDDVSVYTCSAAVTLVSQLDLASGLGVLSQEDEPAFAAFDTQAAADFVSPELFRIGGVEVPGFYQPGHGPTPRLNISFHADAAGFPGTAACSYDGLRSGIDFSDSAGKLAVTLPVACCLPPGPHWLVAQADMDFDTDGSWFWQQRAAVSGLPFRWRNPGDGYGTGCTDWADGTTCLGAAPDLLFALWQVPAAAANATLDDVTIATNAVHEAGLTLTVEDVHLLAPADVTLRGGTSVRFRGHLSVAAGSELRVQIGAPNGCP